MRGCGGFGLRRKEICKDGELNGQRWRGMNGRVRTGDVGFGLSVCADGGRIYGVLRFGDFSGAGIDFKRGGA